MFSSRTFCLWAVILLAVAGLTFSAASQARAGFLDDVGKVFEDAADQFSKDVDQLGKDLGISKEKKKPPQKAKPEVVEKRAAEAPPESPKMRSAIPDKTPKPTEKAKKIAPRASPRTGGGAHGQCRILGRRFQFRRRRLKTPDNSLPPGLRVFYHYPCAGHQLERRKQSHVQRKQIRLHRRHNRSGGLRAPPASRFGRYGPGGSFVGFFTHHGPGLLSEK